MQINEASNDRAVSGVLRYIVTPFGALLGGVIGSVPVYLLGLTVPIFLVGPLALLSGSLLAAIFSGWVANFAILSGNFNIRTKSRIWMIFAVALVAAVVGLGAGFAVAEIVNVLDPPINLATAAAVYLPGSAIFCVATTLATWRLRSPSEIHLNFWGVLALALGGVWVLFVALAGGLGYLLGLVPAGFTASLPLTTILVAGLVLIPLGVLLAWHPPQSSANQGLERDAGISLAVAGALPVLVLGLVYLGCSIWYCGP